MARINFRFKHKKMPSKMRLDEDSESFDFGDGDDEEEKPPAAGFPMKRLPTVEVQQPNILMDSNMAPPPVRSWVPWVGEPNNIHDLKAPSPVPRLAACSSSTTPTVKPAEGDHFVPNLLVMRGDPTDWSAAAIVCDTDSSLRLNFGLAEKIVCKGGVDIQRRCNEWIYYNGKVPVGSAMWTMAGRLPSKFIIHTVGPDVSQYRGPTPLHQFELRRAVRSALNVANSLGVTSVAIPALCTGVNHYPKFLATREIVAECLAFCDDCLSTSLRLIVLMNEDEVTTSMFVQAMKDARLQRQAAPGGSAGTFGYLLSDSSDESSVSSDGSELEGLNNWE